MKPLAAGWVRNILLAMVSVGAALALMEFAVRALAPQPTGLSHQDRFGLALHYPGITRYLPQYGHDVTFNHAGMRDVEHSIVKPDGVFRILLLGDSFMEALQVPFEASLPYLLQDMLEKQTGRQVEVINAGVSGWGTDDELRYLTEYGLKYQPDLVVIAMTLHNDISDNLRQEWHHVENGKLVESHKEPFSYLGYKKIELKAYLATRFQLYQLWRRVRHGSEMRHVGQQLQAHVVQLFVEPTPEPIQQGVALTSALLKRAQEAVAAAGGKLVVVLLPVRYQLSDSDFAEFVQSAGVSPAAMPRDKVQKLVLPILDSLRVPVIDLLPSFQRWTAEGSPQLYLQWDGHWNAVGHRVAARVVATELRERGLVPPASSVLPAEPQE